MLVVRRTAHRRSLLYFATMLKKCMGVLSIAAVVAVGVAVNAQAPDKQYKTPRRPWGDPDFQGNFTNLYEAGTPLERPEQFAGKKLSDVTADELRAFKKKIQDDTIQRFETR